MPFPAANVPEHIAQLVAGAGQTSSVRLHPSHRKRLRRVTLARVLLDRMYLNAISTRNTMAAFPISTRNGMATS